MSKRASDGAKIPLLDLIDGLNQSIKSEDPPSGTYSKILFDRDEVEGLSIRAPAYDSKFQLVLDSLNELTTDLLKAIPEQHHQHAIFKHLVKQLKRAATCPASRKRRINVIGKSGAGKSTLMNCLMGLVGFAKADIATGCTTIPTSHEAPFADQILDFAAHIQYFSIKTIRQRLTSMWHDYYDFHFEENKSDWTEDDRQDARQSAQTALDALCSLFRSHDAFSTDLKAKQTLKALRFEHIDNIIGPWVTWCRDVLPTSGQEGDDLSDLDDRIPVLKFETSTQQELRAQLDIYAYPDTRRTSFWPLVDTIRVGLRGVRILSYVTLVDWPGAGDTNDLRGKASTGRVADCDEVWIVSDPNRICTDPAIWRSISRFAATHPCSIICTKVDEKCDDFTDMDKIRKDGFEMGEIDDLRASEKDTSEHVETYKNTLQEWTEIIGRGFQMLPDNKRLKVSQEDVAQRQARLPEVQNELFVSQRKLSDIQRDRRTRVVEIRNAWLRTQMHSQLKREISAAYHVDVFFASSRHYLAHKKLETVSGALLPLADTGIPGLRQHILRQASPGIVTSARHYITGEVSRVLEGVGVAAAPKDLADCHAVLEHIKKKHNLGVQAQQSYMEATDDESSECFVRGIEGKRQRLAIAAVKVVEGLREWHAMSLKAFIAKDGDFATQRQKAQRWNEKFAGKLGDIILRSWNSFAATKVESTKTLESFLKAELRDIIQLSSTKRGASKRLADREGQFRVFVETQVQQLTNKCDNAAEMYAVKMRSVRNPQSLHTPLCTND